MRRWIPFLLVLALLVSGTTVLADAAPEETGGTEETVEIATGAEFAAFAENCALDTYSQGVTFSLTADIDLTGTDFAPVPWFGGTFLGNGHLILGLEVAGDGSRTGLFRTVAEGASVSGLRVRGSVTPGGTREYVGGLAGVNLGTIADCSFEGTVAGLQYVGGIAGSNGQTGTLTGCTFAGDVTGEHQAGGVAGENLGAVDNCENAGEVNTALITPESEPSFDVSALSQEDFADLANIGGIAGDNQGVISTCRNNGTVGYSNSGYNVGGIAGKTSGYITGCENRGQVLGRRDAGGIAGQLTPYAAWNFEGDAMAALEGELNSLRHVISSASQAAGDRNAQVTAAIQGMNDAASRAITALEEALRIYEENGNSLADRIQIDPETGEITILEPNLSGLDASALTSALADLYADSGALSEALHASLSSVAGNLQTLGNQVTRVMNSMYAALNQLSDETLYSTRDLSAEETYDHDLGAVADCVSYAAVEAENNAGGVVGSIGFDIEFDRENELNASQFLTSNAEQSLFAAVRGCSGYGEISVRDSRAGGIAGSMDMGCLADCVSAGAVSARDGDFAGGTAGYAVGTLDGCWARSVLSGNKYVGGLAGRGENLRRCRAWAHIDAAAEYAGAVAGWADGTVEENLYVDGETPGVDGVSFTGQTDPVSGEELLKLEDAPEGFGNVTVTFVDEDGKTVKTLKVPFGEGVHQLPPVDNRGDAYWQWEDFDADHIYYSRTVTGKYYAPETALAWGGEPPVLLAEGVFYQGQTLTAVTWDGWPEPAEVLASYTVLVNDYTGELTVHLRGESGGALYLVRDGEFERVSYRTDGQYIVFPLENGGSFVYVAAPEKSGYPLLPFLGAGALAGLLLLFLLRRRKKKKAAQQAAEAGTDAAEQTPPSAPETGEQPPEGAADTPEGTAAPEDPANPPEGR